MIARLRLRHRNLVLLAALAAPMVLVTALWARSPVVHHAALGVDGNILPEGTVLIASNSLSVGAAALSARLYARRDSDLASYLAIGKTENRKSAGPDVLVYWQRNLPQDRLDADAVLLGPLSPQRTSHFELPQPTTRGYVVFYSLGHQGVLSAYPLAQLFEE